MYAMILIFFNEAKQKPNLPSFHYSLRGVGSTLRRVALRAEPGPEANCERSELSYSKEAFGNEKI